MTEAERERAEDEKGLEWVMAFNVKNGRAPTRKEVWQAARREERKRCYEECAQYCENIGTTMFGDDIAKEIRAISALEEKRGEE